jgi:hypothetical protein
MYISSFLRIVSFLFDGRFVAGLYRTGSGEAITFYDMPIILGEGDKKLKTEI